MTVSKSSRQDIVTDHDIPEPGAHRPRRGRSRALPAEAKWPAVRAASSPASADVAMKAWSTCSENWPSCAPSETSTWWSSASRRSGAAPNQSQGPRAVRGRAVRQRRVRRRDRPALRQRRVAVVPSLYEGFSLPAVEAMASGVPLVATTGGALPEVAGQDGETALLASRVTPKRSPRWCGTSSTIRTSRPGWALPSERVIRALELAAHRRSHRRALPGTSGAPAQGLVEDAHRRRPVGSARR